MRTRMPFNAISYNTIPFLTSRLDEMRKQHYIENYLIFPHQADCDDRKDHRHVLIWPNKTIDTMDFTDQLKEFDPNYPTKPLTTGRIWQENSIDDWILYVHHDSGYLRWKEMERNILDYSKDLMIASDYDLFENLYYHAYNESEYAKDANHKKLLDDPNIKLSSLIGTRFPYQMTSNLINYRKLKKDELIEDEYKKRLESKNLPSPPELTDEQKNVIELRTKSERIIAEKEKALREVFEKMNQTKL